MSNRRRHTGSRVSAMRSEDRAKYNKAIGGEPKDTLYAHTRLYGVISTEILTMCRVWGWSLDLKLPYGFAFISLILKLFYL